MTSIILPSRKSAQPSNARASNLALSNGCGALLLPTDTGWSDSLNLLSVTGAVGSPVTVANTSGVARSYSATADFFHDGGVLDPTGGYAWIMHCALTSSGGNWGGLIARTRDNATTAGWGWQKDNSGNISVYHGSTNRYSFGSVAPLIDSLPHTFLGLWRTGTNEVELWRDGELFWSGSLATVPDFWTGQGQIKLFSSRDTATFAGTATMAGLFTGNMDQGVASDLSANPWQLFGGKRVLYFDAVSGGPGATQLVVSPCEHASFSDSATLSADGSSPLTVSDAVHSSSSETVSITPVGTVAPDDDEPYPGAVFGFLPTLGGEVIVAPTVAPTLTLTPNAAAGTVSVEWDTVITQYMTHDVEIRLPI